MKTTRKSRLLTINYSKKMVIIESSRWETDKDYYKQNSQNFIPDWWRKEWEQTSP